MPSASPFVSSGLETTGRGLRPIGLSVDRSRVSRQTGGRGTAVEAGTRLGAPASTGTSPSSSSMPSAASGATIVTTTRISRRKLRRRKSRYGGRGKNIKRCALGRKGSPCVTRRLAPPAGYPGLFILMKEI